MAKRRPTNVHLDSDSDVITKIIGIVNYDGNSCFISAMAQMIFHMLFRVRVIFEAYPNDPQADLITGVNVTLHVVKISMLIYIGINRWNGRPSSLFYILLWTLATDPGPDTYENREILQEFAVCLWPKDRYR